MSLCLFCAIIVFIPVLAHCVLSSSSRKNVRRYGFVHNEASFGAMVFATMIVIIGVVVIVKLVPSIIW